MKQLIVVSLISSSLFTAHLALAATPQKLTTENQKISYAIGLKLGTGLRKQGMHIDSKLLYQGLLDGLSGTKNTLISQDGARKTLVKYQQARLQKQQNAQQEKNEKNKLAGEAFLAANKKKPGVITLPSGLQYKILKPGTGPKPTENDEVEVNYVGTLLNGKEFDSSYKHGKPATFRLSKVIRGWTQALQLMRTGATWEIFVPPDLAYGAHGVGNIIAPYETLKFTIQLIAIK